MTRAQLIAKQGMTLDIYLKDMIPSAAMLVKILYPDIAQEYADSDTGYLFDTWVSNEYPELVRFLRSLSIIEKINLVIETLDQEM